MTTLVVRQPGHLKTRLTRAARDAGQSPAQFVREILKRKLMASRIRSIGRGSLFKLSRDLCGNVKGGPTDLSTNKRHMSRYGL